MSYRNPIQVIDTKTGKVFRDVIDGLTDAGRNYSRAYIIQQEKQRIEAEKIKKENEALEKQRRNYELMTGSGTMAAVRNLNSIFDSTDLTPFNESINISSDLSTQPVLNQTEKTYLQNVSGSVGVLKKDTENIALLNTNNTILNNNKGQQGGADEYQPSENFIFANGISGQGDYKRYIVPDYTQQGGANFTYFVETPDGRKVSRNSSALSNEVANPGNSTIWQVPNEAKNHEQIAKLFLKNTKLGFTIENIKDEFFLNDNGEFETIESTDEKSGITKYVQRLNIKKMRDVARPIAKNKVKGLGSRGQLSYNNFLSGPNGINSGNFSLDYKKELNDEQKALLVEDYIDFNLSNYGSINLDNQEANVRTLRSEVDKTKSATIKAFEKENQEEANKIMRSVNNALISGNLSFLEKKPDDLKQSRYKNVKLVDSADGKSKNSRIQYQKTIGSGGVDKEFYYFDLKDPFDLKTIYDIIILNKYPRNNTKGIQLREIISNRIDSVFENREQPIKASTREEAKDIIAQQQNQG